MAAPLVWTQAISVRIPEIDTQHQCLFAIINDLIAARERGNDGTMILTLIGRLVAYSGTHFRTEEHVMIDHAFPRFVEHNATHLNYMKEVERFIHDFKANTEGLSDEMLDYLTHWWREHVSRSDMEYARHIHNT